MKFEYYTPDTAPDDAKSLMEESISTFGMLPNLHRILAEAPITYKAYNDAFGSFMQASSLTPLEQQVVFMASNVFNRCHYCIPGHTWMMKTQNMPEDVIVSLRQAKPINDEKLETLRLFTIELWEKHGHVESKTLEKIAQVGFSKQQILEVLTGMSAKLISNYANAIAQTELDEPMQKYAWSSTETTTL